MLIVAIAIGVVSIMYLALTTGFAAGVLKDFVCATNVKIATAIGILVTPPLWTCRQYEEPIEIDAMDLDNCPGIAEICEDPPDLQTKEDCYKQCARIQIDQLTDRCFYLVNEGRKPLAGYAELAVHAVLTAFKGVEIILQSDYQLLDEATDIVGVDLGSEFTYEDAVEDAQAAQVYGLFRCFRFKIIRPRRSLVDPSKDFAFEDSRFGNSWTYGYGGEGVTPVSIFKKLETKEIDDYKIDRSYWHLLNYEYPKADEVCYISYQDPVKAIERHCGAWSYYGSEACFLAEPILICEYKFLN